MPDLPHLAGLFAVGVALGATLYHASFGFTGAFRALLVRRETAGVRAILLMLAVACALFFPALGQGAVFGQDVAGFVAPLDTALVAGAALFGIGMQLGGGCASGTLFALGGGHVRMLIVLAGFIAGSVLGVAHLPQWQALPGLPAVSLLVWLGWPQALALQLLVLALLWWLLARLNRSPSPQPAAPYRVWRGPWPLAAGAIALAVLNFATLLLSGHPWGITSAFALWGGKIAAALGSGIADWGGWAGQGAMLAQPVLRDVTSLMDFGIVLGAMLAAVLAGRFAPGWRVPLRSAIAAVLGGLLMGYGARLASGCNIGAFFSGVASGSLHGWVWLVCAMAGNGAGIRLRPYFGLVVERTPAVT